jgi:tRNA-splicing ligase RtcB (3'-phosphate/5'-hydroxy nucleic acid ligase)
MDTNRFTRIDATAWRIEPQGSMRVPGIIYADENLIRDMDDKVYEQVANVAALPGIVRASYAMPDAHWGYGFPIGGVAAFDPDKGGVVSGGGVGFDISCGVRTMLTGLTVPDILPVQKALADSLFQRIPAGLGSKGAITLDSVEMDAMLTAGAHWAVERGLRADQFGGRPTLSCRYAGRDQLRVRQSRNPRPPCTRRLWPLFRWS